MTVMLVLVGYLLGSIPFALLLGALGCAGPAAGISGRLTCCG